MNFKMLSVLFSLFFVSSSSFGEMYKWVDSNGATHWTNTAPPESAEQVISSGEVPYSAPAQKYRNQEVVVSSERSEPPLDVSEMKVPPSKISIDDKIIALEKRRLEKKLKYYGNECIAEYSGRAKDKHKKWCNFATEKTKKRIKELENDPELYFYMYRGTTF